MKTYSLLSILTILLCAFGTEASYAASKRILISVGDLYENSPTKTWERETCRQIYTLANQIAEGGVDVTCRQFETSQFSDKSLGNLQKSFDYHLRIIRDRKNDIGVDVTNWNRKHESDFKSLGWNFTESKNSKVSKEDAFAKAIGNFFYYASNEIAYKAGLLVNGAAESDDVEYDQKNGVFRDKITNTPITVEKAYSLFEKESDRKKNYLRAGVEIGVMLSAGLAVYYKNLAYNAVDFDYTLKDGIKKKFSGEAMLFDDNDKFANYGHVYAGVMYYQVARSNGFNALESFLITFASSAAWEFIEYQEVFSINDQILTPVGGYIIGEATYQISCALTQKNSVAAKALGYTINPSLAMNHGIDAVSKKDKNAATPDCKKPRWSDISVYVGLEKGQKAYEPNLNNDYVVGMNAEVVTLSGYNREGSEKKLVFDTAMVKMNVENNGNQGAQDLRVIAQVVAAAYYQKNRGVDEKGQLRGYDLILGLGSASMWDDRGQGRNTGDTPSKEDFYGTISILGATAHANVHYKGFNIRADFAFYGDFAMVKSYALDSFSASRGGDLSDQSGVVRKRGYYWGAGTSTLAAISIEKGRFEVGYEGRYSHATSINERQRLSATSNDIYRDSFMTNKIYVTFSITKNLKFQLSQEYNVRTGTVNNEHRTEGIEKRTMGTLIYKF